MDVIERLIKVSQIDRMHRELGLGSIVIYRVKAATDEEVEAEWQLSRREWCQMGWDLAVVDQDFSPVGRGKPAPWRGITFRLSS